MADRSVTMNDLLDRNLLKNMLLLEVKAVDERVLVDGKRVPTGKISHYVYTVGFSNMALKTLDVKIENDKQLMSADGYPEVTFTNLVLYNYAIGDKAVISGKATDIKPVSRQSKEG